MTINRRRVLGVGAAAAAATVLVNGTAFAQEADIDDDTSIPTTAEQARRKIARDYQRQVDRAGGTWS
jgi:beta-lactamase class A